MLETNNFGLQKPEKMIDNVDIDVINGNMDVVDKGLVLYLGTTSGAANAYTVVSEDIKSLAEGVAVCVKFHTAASAASTLNINGWGAKAIKKTGGADVTNLKASMYTLRYDGTNFILQGEGASGNATASDLLLNKTATTDAGEITGTIPSKSAATYTPGTSDQTIAAGQYLSGAQTIKATTGTAVAGDVLSGKTFNSAAGIGLAGAIPSKAAASYNPSTAAQTIAAAQYLSGAQTINPVTGTATVADVASGKTFSSAAGISLTGTLANGKKFASGTVNSGVLNTSNITCYRAGGTYTWTVTKIVITGLSFKPSFVYMERTNLIGYYVTMNKYHILQLSIPSDVTGTNVDNSIFYLTNGGFSTTTFTNNGFDYNWIAYE